MMIRQVPPAVPRNLVHQRWAWLGIWWRPAVVVWLTTTLYFVVPMRRADLTTDGPTLVRAAAFLLGMAGLTWLVGHQVRRALRGRLTERIAVLVTLVQVVVVFFAVLYVRLADEFDGMHTRLDALYFAMTTLTTVGYGDITATGQNARGVVTVQMFFDLIIVTSALSIVISAGEGSAASPASGADPGEGANRNASPSRPD